MRFITILDI